MYFDPDAAKDVTDALAGNMHFYGNKLYLELPGNDPYDSGKYNDKKHVVHKKHQSWNKNSGIHAEKQWNVNKGPHAENNRWTNNYVPQGESWSNDYKPYGENSTQSKMVNESSHKTLPQTGERHSIMTIMLGSLLAATGLMALFIDDKRKKN